MNQAIPPLPKLEIIKRKNAVLDQETVDRVLTIIHDQRPDLFAKMAARDRAFENGELTDDDSAPYDDFTNDFNAFLVNEVSKQVPIPNVQVMTSIFRETRRRARLMYGMTI